MAKRIGKNFLVFAFILLPLTTLAGQADSGTWEGVPPQEPKVEETFVTPDEVESLGIPAPDSAQPATTTPSATTSESVPRLPTGAPTPSNVVPDVLLVETETVAPTNIPEPDNTLMYILAGLGALLALGVAGFVSMKSRAPSKEETGRCMVEKQVLDACEAELGALRAELNIHETALDALKDKGADMAKGKLDGVLKKIRESLEKRNGLSAKAGKALGVTDAGVNKLLDAKDTYETAVELIENFKILLSAKQAEVTTERALYEACMGAVAGKSALAGAEAVLPTAGASKVVLLDRDGTIIRDPADERVDTEEKIELFPDTLESLRLLAENGYSVILITNQAGISEGRIMVADFERIHAEVLKKLTPSGIKILKTYMCPHGPSDGCDCRKPKPKLLLDAMKEFNINARDTYMVGDRESDVLAGASAGTKTILVKTGNIVVNSSEATYSAPTLMDAVRFIVKK